MEFLLYTNLVQISNIYIEIKVHSPLNFAVDCTSGYKPTVDRFSAEVVASFPYSLSKP